MKVWIKHRENQDIEIIIPHIKLIERKIEKLDILHEIPYNLVFRILKFDRKRLSQKYVTQIFEKTDDSTKVSIERKITQHDYVEEIKISKPGILGILRRNYELMKTLEYTLNTMACPELGENAIVDKTSKEITRKVIWLGVLIKYIEDNWTE